MEMAISHRFPMKRLPILKPRPEVCYSFVMKIRKSPRDMKTGQSLYQTLRLDEISNFCSEIFRSDSYITSCRLKSPQSRREKCISAEIDIQKIPILFLDNLETKCCRIKKNHRIWFRNKKVMIFSPRSDLSKFRITVILYTIIFYEKRIAPRESA